MARCTDPEAIRPHELGAEMGSCHTCAMTQPDPFDHSGEPECDICRGYMDVKSVGLELLCCLCRNDRKEAE